MNKYISICIPTYEMHGLGAKFLKHSFDIMKTQTYKNFEVIISDNSNDDKIEKLCEEYKDEIDIKYYKNSIDFGSSANLNNAISKASGILIKILFQDDFLYDTKSLKNIVDNFDLEKDSWLVTACEHTKDGINLFRRYYPKYNEYIHLGENTISSPSVLTIKNKDHLIFDNNLNWLMDCDYYKRCYNKFGKPKIMNEINVVNRVGKHQVTNTQINFLSKIKEYKYISKKFKESFLVNMIHITKNILIKL